MARAKAHLSTSIPADLYTAALEYSEESGRPFARLVEEALRLYLIRRLGDDYGPGRMDNLIRRQAGEI